MNRKIASIKKKLFTIHAILLYSVKYMQQRNMGHSSSTAYFSMEIGFHDHIPSYSGGLGILAGDTLAGAADLGLDMVGVTLLYKHGYFKQVLDNAGRQHEEQEHWDVEQYLELTDARGVISIAGRVVHIQVWKYILTGVEGHEVPIYFLDTDLSANMPEDRAICSNLYPTDLRLRLHQSLVLGIGGVQILRDLGYGTFGNYHLNETHPWPLVLGLARNFRSFEEVQERLVFTTHTPLAGGHEQYKRFELAKSMEARYLDLIPEDLYVNGKLNTAELCLEHSKYANAVALKHQEVSKAMYPSYNIQAVTNGIHSNTWVNPNLGLVFDKYIPNWSRHAFDLRQALTIPLEAITNAHTIAKTQLMEYINQHVHDKAQKFSPNIFTIGFARRAATYKRHNLIFSDKQRLEEIAKKHGGIQIVFAGKAYPNDEGGKQLIQEIVALNKDLSKTLNVVYLPDYSISLSHKIVTGVDLWLNNPQPPLEASGTSGMKAALNGIPNFSILDGWWLEGCVEGVTGWAIGNGASGERELGVELESLYSKLDTQILPLFYTNTQAWNTICRQAIALNASYFNTHRMVMEYLTEAYSHSVESYF
jgi:glycogen phosphorylase